MALNVKEALDIGLVKQVGNKTFNPGRMGTKNLSGANSTLVERCDDNTGNVWSMYTTAGVDVSSTPANPTNSKNRININSESGVKYAAARGWGNTIAMMFQAAGDYASLNLGAGEDWQTQDDNLVFWLWSDRAFDATEFDLELRDSSNALITDADYAVVAMSEDRKWQLYVIDTASETLTDVQYIRIVMDGSNATELRICDIVRTDANCLNNAYYADLLVSTNLGCQARKVHVNINDWTFGEKMDVYINSLGNDPHTIFTRDYNNGTNITGDLEINDEEINAIFINGATDTSVTLDLFATGRYVP